MNEPLPKFRKPPVVETVLSAQFQRLPGFRTAHAGCFWQDHLDLTWKLQETVRIDDQFERFGDERKWGPPSGFRFLPDTETRRTQIVRADDSGMIQIQDSRFIYNWKKSGDGTYPSYNATKAEFAKWYAKFHELVGKFELGKVEENQWEVTYVNHLLKGDLWETPQDWQKIFPWLIFPAPKHSQADTVVTEWTSVIGDQAGRLHTHLGYGRTSQEGPEALILTLIARGPAGEKVNRTVENGFEIGHECIVRSFAEMTSRAAHERWERIA